MKLGPFLYALAVVVGHATSATNLSNAIAGGQFVGDNGAAATARGGAFVAKADDPTSIMHNPAAMGLANEMQVTVGANLISMSQEFQRAGVYENLGERYTGEKYPTVRNASGVQPIPFAGAVFPHGRWTFGAGLFAPQSYAARKYPNEVTLSNGSKAPAPQRYDSVAQSSRVAFPTLAIAYRISSRLRLGASFGWGFATVASEKAVQGLSSPGEEPRRDLQTSLEASDKFIPAFGIGGHYAAAPSIEIGANWTAPMAIRAVGRTSSELGADLMEPIPGLENRVVPVQAGQERCARGGVEGSLASCLNFNLPMTATIGVRYAARDEDGTEIGDLELDVRWENWSSSSDFVAVIDGKNTAHDARLNDAVIRHGLHDSISVRVGGSGRITRGKRNLIARAGVAYESASAPDTWTRLDIDSSQHFSAATGLGADFGRYHVDVGVAAFTSPDREVRDVALGDSRDTAGRVQPDATVASAEAASQPYHPINAGNYKTSYVVGSVNVTASW